MTELQPQNLDLSDRLPSAKAGGEAVSDGNSAWMNLSAGLWQADLKITKANYLLASNDAPGPVAPAKPIYNNTAPSDAEFEFMRTQGAISRPDDVLAIRYQIARAAQDPETALLNAAKNNRVIGFGDIHGPLGPHMSFLAEEMPKLKQSGVTNLAVEIPQVFQGYVDNWTAADQEFLRQRLKDKSSLIKVIDSAKKAGLKVDCVDESYGDGGEKLASRDRTMAKNIQGILTDQSAKVAFFVGAEHLQNGFRTDSFGPSAAELLRQKNISIATFLQQPSSSEDALMPIARDLKTAVSVNKADVGMIGPLKNSAGTTYDKWDNVVFYPPHYKMEAVEAELKQFGEDPKAELAGAVKGNRAVLLGEMSQAEPEDPVSAHRKFMAAEMPDLKKAGLTDLAIDIPPNYQSSLDQFNRTGKMNGLLPGPYDKDDFTAVLTAAQAQGIKLHAVGLQNESLASIKDIIDGLAASSQKLADANPQGKVMVWCREEKMANFKDEQGKPVSLSLLLAGKGVSNKAYASFTQDFTDQSLGLVTEITPAPLTFEPSKTSLLAEVPNTFGLQMDRFDNVIVYPSRGAN